jgi:hypothetical protein
MWAFESNFLETYETTFGKDDNAVLVRQILLQLQERTGKIENICRDSRGRDLKRSAVSAQINFESWGNEEYDSDFQEFGIQESVQYCIRPEQR